jgi:hypothetical protein
MGQRRQDGDVRRADAGGGAVNPDVSIVMSVYNDAAVLPATIESILHQQDAAFELIAIDDGSTDGSGDILDRAVAADDRIRVIHSENRGLTRQLIAGCAAARAPYIARHDAGDLSAPGRLRKQKLLLDANPRLAFVSCWTQFAGPELEPMWVMKGSGVAIEPVDILDASQQHGVTDGPTHHGSVMFRRDAYERAGGYRAEFYYGQDWDLWYRLAAAGRFQIVPEVLYTARVTPSSISGTNRAAQETLAELSRAALLARLRGAPEEPILARAAAVRPLRRGGRGSRGRGLYFVGEALRRRGDPRARRYFDEAMRAWPSPRIIAGWLRAYWR